MAYFTLHRHNGFYVLEDNNTSSSRHTYVCYAPLGYKLPYSSGSLVLNMSNSQQYSYTMSSASVSDELRHRAYWNGGYGSQTIKSVDDSTTIVLEEDTTKYTIESNVSTECISIVTYSSTYKTNIYIFDNSGNDIALTFYDNSGNLQTATFKYYDVGFYMLASSVAMDTSKPITITKDVPQTLTITNNVDETVVSYSGENPYELTLTANDGYKFDVCPTATYINASGETQTDTFQLSADEKTATLTTANVSTTQLVITVDGTTTPETITPTITNNIANTSATYSGSNHQYVITIKVNDGYLFSDVPEASYTGYSSGTSVSVSFAVASDKKSASGVCPDVDENYPIELTGNTVEETNITVNNNISDTTETHTYDGTNLSVTIKGNYTTYRFKSAQLVYTDSDGNSQTVDMSVTTVDNAPTATAQVTNVKNNTTVNVNGTFVFVTPINTKMSNCTVEGAPSYLFSGDELTVTITANENTHFEVTPTFVILTSAGLYETQELTLNEDNKIATGTYTNPDAPAESVTINANATPDSVIGSNYGAIHVYKVTMDNLEAFSKKRFFKEAVNSDGTEFTLINLGNYVNRIHRVFFGVPTASTDVIKCGNYNTGVECETPETDTVTLNFGAITVPTPNGDATDYLSELKMFVPFSGFVSIPVDYVGKTLSLVYTVNVITGGGVAKVMCGDDVVTLVEVEPCEDIIYQTNLDNLATIGGDEWNEKLLYGVEPYLQVRYYNSLNKEERNNDYVNIKLGDMSGFCVVDDVVLSTTAEMTADEQGRIITLLKQGVYIE